MSIIQSLAKIKQSRKNVKSKNTTCDVRFSIDGDSPTLSTNKQPFHSKQGLVCWTINHLKKRVKQQKRDQEENTPSTLIAKDMPLESMHQNTVQPVLYQDKKMSFLN